MLGVGIIGAGLIGTKRAAQLKGAQLRAVADLKSGRALSLARAHDADMEASWQTLVRRPDISAVIVSTTHDALLPCASAALRAGKHVLIEKPAGRNPSEIRRLIDLARRSRRVVRVGFNHRFHPAFQRIKRLMREDAVGPLMFIRARYGHGGRVGYEREWRADSQKSGGGELLDQGVHLIDLCRWLGGEFELEWGKALTLFWKMPVEDNGFLMLRAPKHPCYAFLHAGWTEWKNLFDFEVFGKTGKLEVFGLGKSYGPEELRYYKMKPEMGPPEIDILKFEGEDRSWEAEFQAFLAAIQGKKSEIATLEDALKAVQIVHQVYRRR